MLTVYYSCGQCGAKNRPVKVRFRKDNEDIKFWIEHVVGNAVKHDHTLQALFCENMHMENLIIPGPPEGDMIGGPTTISEALTPERLEALQFKPIEDE